MGSVGSAAAPSVGEIPRGLRAQLAVEGWWATQLHRVWQVDALACPRCAGRLRFIATITERSVIVRILDHLGIPSERVIAAPARSGFDTR